MSSILMDIPTLQVNGNDLPNLLTFIYKHEELLKHYGAIKIQLSKGCKLALKKRRKSLMLCPIPKQIVKINKSEPVYCVKEVSHIDKSIQESSSITDEHSFWSSLSSLSNNKARSLNISLTSSSSFFAQKTSNLYFDIHRLPKQSLLKLAGNKIVRQFVPCVRRAHGAGAIFPLNCAKQRLFSIDYHHEGGNHHWLIIPTCERENLQKLLGYQNSSICLDHGQLFIDPSILDKNHIRYYRTIQHPNEFVVLSAGTLAQSFTENASWSESISFALPSWIEDGHAKIPIPICQCNIYDNLLPEMIATNLFRCDLIQKYVTLHLNIGIDNQSKALNGYNTNNISTIAISSYNVSNDLSNVETKTLENMELNTLLEPVNSCFHTPPRSLQAPSVSSNGFEEIEDNSINNDCQMQYQILEEGIFSGAFDWDVSETALISSITDGDRSEAIIQENQRCHSTSTAMNTYRSCPNSYSVNDNFLSYEELTDLMSSNTDNILSTREGADASIKTIDTSLYCTNAETTIANNRSHIKNKQVFHNTKSNHKTLFVSGLKTDVNASDIRRQFIGCKKVTIKRYRSTPHLKYAFVVHRTSREAKNNLEQHINFCTFGHECRVEYAKNYSTHRIDQQDFERTKVVISQIPENVSEAELHHLFINSRLIKYCPARTVPITLTVTKTKDDNKMLWGHAVLLYNNEQLAANAIKHADRYQIHGHPLVISLYRNKKSFRTMTK